MHPAFHEHIYARALVFRGSILLTAEREAWRARIAAIQESRRTHEEIVIHLRWRREPEIVQGGEFVKRGKWK